MEEVVKIAKEHDDVLMQLVQRDYDVSEEEVAAILVIAQQIFSKQQEKMLLPDVLAIALRLKIVKEIVSLYTVDKDPEIVNGIQTLLKAME